MIDYLNGVKLKEGLINKKHSFKELNGLTARLDLMAKTKNEQNLNILNNLIEHTNYPNIFKVLRGLDNAYLIDSDKSDWFLYAIKKNNVSNKDIVILQHSLLNGDNLVYISEKNSIEGYTYYYVIFSKTKYAGSHEYVNHMWQEKKI